MNKQDPSQGTNAPMTTDFSNTTPATLTTAPQEDEASGADQVTPDTLKVDPAHPASNNPFGSTGEKEPDVDAHQPRKDDPK